MNEIAETLKNTQEIVEAFCGGPRITKSQEAPSTGVDDERKKAKTEGQKDNANRKDRDNERRG